jgi:hypothetical protein
MDPGGQFRWSILWSKAGAIVGDRRHPSRAPVPRWLERRARSLGGPPRREHLLLYSRANVRDGYLPPRA